jgi:chromosome partitioning protein
VTMTTADNRPASPPSGGPRQRTGLGWPGSLPMGRHLGWPDITRVPAQAGVSRETSPSMRTAAEIAAEADDREPAMADTPIAAETAEALRASRGSRGSPLPRPAQTRVVTVANQKGGVGKTTTTVNLAAALAQQGARVLVLDLDPQGNASTALGIDHHADVPSIYEVLIEGRPIGNVISAVEAVPGLFCVPATIDLAGAEIELVSLVARESRLHRAVTALLDDLQDDQTGGYDYVFVDCPPSLGLLTVNALVAGAEVLIPIQCEYYALEGLGQLMRNVELIRSHLNPRLHVSTILLTMYDARTRLAAQVADEVRTHFGHLVLRTTVPRSVRISEAPSYGETVMTYDPGSSGALSYLEAAREFADRHAQGVPAGEEGDKAPSGAAPGQQDTSGNRVPTDEVPVDQGRADQVPADHPSIDRGWADHQGPHPGASEAGTIGHPETEHAQAAR